MTLPFDTWTLEQAKKAAALGENIKPLVEKATAFYSGDHWQNGDGWIGPRPLAGEEGEQETLTMIQRAFVSRNVIKEIVDRHSRGVVGHEPAWRFVPRRALKQDEEALPAEQAEIDVIEAALTEWWDERKVHGIFKDSVADLLQAQRSNLRLYVPKGLLVEGTVTAADGSTTQTKGVSVTNDVEENPLAGGLAWIFIDHPLPSAAAVYTDPDSQQSVGVVIYKPNAGAVDKEEGVETAELTYLNEAGQTVIRTVTADTSGAKAFIFDLGGHITHFQMGREPLITTQLTESQKALNLALSMLPRNVVTGGFLERVLLNAQMPGYWVDSSGQKTNDINARVKFVPLPYKAGSGTTNFIRGYDYRDEKTGETKVTDPSITYREPSPVTAPIEAKRSHYQDMLEEADQAHILLQSEATPSGRSRDQARADYIASLTDSQSSIEECGRWLMETVLAQAEMFAGSPNNFIARYRCEFTCRLNAGPIDDATRTADETSVEKGTLSLETAMTRNGVVDVDAEIAKINEQPGSMLDRLKRQFEVIVQATGAGMSLVGAAKLVGLEEDDLKIVEEDVASIDPNDQPENGDVPPPEPGANGDRRPAPAREPVPAER